MKNAIKFFFLTVFILTFSLSLSITAQQQEPAPVKASQVKGNIYEVKGGRGANAGFFIGEKEVLVIDAKMTEESAKQMIAEIKKLTSNPIKHVILTHSDGDHVNGLVGFPADVIIATHHQTAKDMDAAFKDAKLRSYLPDFTFSKKLKLHSGDKTVKLFHFGPAHTSGDVVVYFPEEKVAFIGDLLFLGRDPLIHRHKNGNSFGFVKTLKSILKLGADTFIHGHGSIASPSDLEDVIKSLEEKQAKIKALIKEGKSLEEIKKIYSVEDRPSRPGRIRRPGLIETIYLEFTEKK
jgi:glyoxylase-like metal-dependent hydrolase (beta-lactamase superfamily II)